MKKEDAVSPVVEALVRAANDEKRLVEDALVMIEEEAKMFCEKRLRKRSELEPSERVISVVGRISASVLIVL